MKLILTCDQVLMIPTSVIGIYSIFDPIMFLNGINNNKIPREGLEYISRTFRQKI